MGMTEEQLYVVLNEVFRDVFKDESIEICASTTAEDIEKWDSLEHINLVIAIEKKLNIEFTREEVNTMERGNVGKMAEIILEAFNRRG